MVWAKYSFFKLSTWTLGVDSGPRKLYQLAPSLVKENENNLSWGSDSRNTGASRRHKTLVSLLLTAVMAAVSDPLKTNSTSYWK